MTVQELIDGAIARESKTKTAGRDQSVFNISDAGGCYRRRWYKRMGVEPTVEISPQALRKMTAGDAGHEKLAWLLRGQLFAKEGVINLEHIKGHFDAIVKEGTNKTLIEFKTTEKWQMSHIVKDGPKRPHELQMLLYWYWARRDYTNLDQAVLSYVRREDFYAKDFVYAWSEDWAAEVELEWAPLIGYWERQELPPCTCIMEFDGKGIQYCRYQTGESCCSIDIYHNLKGVLDGKRQTSQAVART